MENMFLEKPIQFHSQGRVSIVIVWELNLNYTKFIQGNYDVYQEILLW